MPALYSARAGYEIVAGIGVDAIRQKSLGLTQRLIQRATDAGYRVNTPTADAERAGAVIVDVPDGYAVAQELIRRQVIVDYRPGAGSGCRRTSTTPGRRWSTRWIGSATS